MGGCWCCDKNKIQKSFESAFDAKYSGHQDSNTKKTETVDYLRWTIFRIDIEFVEESAADDAWNKRNIIEQAFPLAKLRLIPKESTQNQVKLKIILSKNNESDLNSKVFYQENPPEMPHVQQAENHLRWVNNDESNCLFIVLLANFLKQYNY